MNIQSSIDDVDRAIAEIKHGTEKTLTPPIFGGPQRDGIIAVSEAIAGEVCKHSRTLRGRLEALEQRALQSVERTRAAMNDHVDACTLLEEEVRRIDAVVASLEEQFRAA